MVHHHFRGYRGKAPDPFAIDVEVRISFGDFRYSVDVGGQNQVRKLYSEPLLKDEAENIATKALAQTFAQIKKLSGIKE